MDTPYTSSLSKLPTHIISALVIPLFSTRPYTLARSQLFLTLKHKNSMLVHAYRGVHEGRKEEWCSTVLDYLDVA